jgi:hypothetical protein
MALNDIIRGAVAIADKVTKPVQVNVTHRAFTGQDGDGARAYAAPVTRKAFVEMSRKLRPRADGTMIPTIASVLFLEPVPVNGAVTDPPRHEPIDPRDIIALPDGATGPIIEGPDAPLDPATNRAFFNQIYLGET